MAKNKPRLGFMVVTMEPSLHYYLLTIYLWIGQEKTKVKGTFIN